MLSLKEQRLNKNCPFRKFHNLFVVYKIQNIINNKVYIGISTSVSKRIRSHLYHFRKKGQLHLHRAMKKYGIKNFNFEILEVAQSKDELASLEKKKIRDYKSNIHKYGYNIASGGFDSKWNKRLRARIVKGVKNKKKVFIYNKNGDFIQEFESINSCATFFGLKHCTILACIYKNLQIKGLYRPRFEKILNIGEHKYKYKEMGKRMIGNKRGGTFIWKIEDRTNDKTYLGLGIRELSEKSGYKESIIRNLAYGRCSKYKNILIITKMERYKDG